MTPRGVTAVAMALVAWVAPVHAQQSLFNAPSTTYTEPGKVFVQEQVNAADAGESNFTAALGLLDGVEVGFNVFKVDLYGRERPHGARGLLMGNAVWTLHPEHWASFQAGFQLGAGTVGQSQLVPVAFGWASTRLSIADDLASLVVGAYAGNTHYLGEGTLAGPLAGVEVVVIPDLLEIQADMLLGNNDASVGVAGLVLLIPGGLQLAAGVQAPSPTSHNGWGLVFEVTHVPHDPYD